MSKSRSKSRSEVEFLRGEVRRLKSELKYYKKRDHLIDHVPEEIEEELIPTANCPSCLKGNLIEWDFKYAVLQKCDKCNFEKKKAKK